ncbi:SDR family oxidoreductase [Herbaspirillum sp. WKF16]|uniref:SDR family oxidoreductase n=1 Tax=Herbaspirillum sp. WKF16 TaxID=3028312 RepID=UPI0023A98811|nr:SDR family oxidoreductase [Herbaspirillum sp. WKF16]WDZ94304.1 SDR family oxidoreductase [Herbaspirillum sp. WKF16]
MAAPRVLVVAAGSDIGAHLVEHHLSQGAIVYGSYRQKDERIKRLEQKGAVLFPLDINSKEQVSDFARQLEQVDFRWDVLISAPGLLEPIGKFFSLDFDTWERSVLTNSTSQLRVLHAVYGLRGERPKLIFFAGGGTNGTFDNYSAYCIGKMSLIKMTELLDSECPELQVSIIGTGWVDTKIHRQTLAAGEAAGANFDRTREYLAGAQAKGASVEDVAQCIDWCIRADRDAVGGRNFSLVHDSWRDLDFTEHLKRNPDIYKLRRRS